MKEKPGIGHRELSKLTMLYFVRCPADQNMIT